MYRFRLKVATALYLLLTISAANQGKLARNHSRPEMKSALERNIAADRDLPVQKRFVCNADNVLRALEHNTPYANFYCQSLIGYAYQPTSVVASPATPTAV